MTDTTARQLTEQELNDILTGACFFGSGGGGPYSLGQQLLAEVLKTGKPVLLQDPEQVPGDARMAVAAGVGSPEAAAQGFPFDAATLAFTALEALLGDAPFDFVLPGEVGAGNSVLPMTVAVSRGIPVVDASGAPRAIPTLPMCTYAAAKLPISPVVVRSESEQITFSAQSAAAADSALRGIIESGTFTEDAGVAMWSMDGAAMRAAAIPGTMTRALELGRALREAAAGGSDPVKVAVERTGGRVLFRGKIVASEEHTTGGFDFGVVTLTGRGGTCRIFNQNENLIAWSDRTAAPLAIAPDLICYLTRQGEVFSNADLDRAQGKEVAVIGVPAGEAMRQESIVAAFLAALQELGYGGAYVPLEKLPRARRQRKAR